MNYGLSWNDYGHELKYKPFDFGLSKEQEQRALDLHKRSIVFDNLSASTFNDAYFQVLAEHGITVIQKTISAREDPVATILNIFDWNKRMKRNKKHVIGPVIKIDEIHKAKEEGKTAYIYGFQNTLAFSYGEIQWVELFYKLGVRIVQLAHNWRNMVADGCGEAPSVRTTRSGHTRAGSDVGLSEYGEEVVDEMNRLGMIVDVSHVGDRSSMEAIARGKVVVASHANARRVCDNGRNKTDECLKAIAAKDGVVGVNALSTMVKWTEAAKGIRPTINDLLDHVAYLVKLIGVDHVGVGFDHIDLWPPEQQAGMLKDAPHLYGSTYPMEGTTGGVYPYPEGIDSEVQFLNFTRGLVSRGYSDKEVQKILGLNWMRVYKKVL